MALFKRKRAEVSPEVKQEEAPVVTKKKTSSKMPVAPVADDAPEASEVYEIGYHIIPSVSDDGVGTEVETIKGLIAKHGGSVISEGAPQLTPLAYTMRKRFEGGYQKFDKAYFGWIKFEGSRETVNAFKSDVETLESVLRFITVKTVRENTLYGDTIVIASEEEAGDDVGAIPKKAGAPKIKTGEEEKEEKGEVVEAELDSKLDELVSDDTVEK